MTPGKRKGRLEPADAAIFLNVAVRAFPCSTLPWSRPRATRARGPARPLSPAPRGFCANAAQSAPWKDVGVVAAAAAPDAGKAMRVPEMNDLIALTVTGHRRPPDWLPMKPRYRREGAIYGWAVRVHGAAADLCRVVVHGMSALARPG